MSHEMARRFGLGRDISAWSKSPPTTAICCNTCSEAGIPCFGIEPTASTAAAARAKGIEIVEEFFGVALASELARRADRPI